MSAEGRGQAVNHGNFAGGDKQMRDAVLSAGHGQLGSGSNVVRAADPLESYERELRQALWWACANASLHAVSRFLALCTLTWALVVLLRAFASFLRLLDFAFIACLLLLEATRLQSASFFIRLPMQYATTHRARICSQMLQFILIFPSFLIPCIRISVLSLDYDVSIRNLQNSLLIFYIFIALDSVVALVNLICYSLASISLNKREEQSILRYYDKVLENAMSVGVVRADDFEFFSFAYNMLGSEYGRDVQPEAVASSNRKLIQYLYAHRLGLASWQIYMDAKDAFVQQAAVNMVGFWADAVWGVGLEEVKLPEGVLTKLADKVGTGQVGWAATSSFGVLAHKPDGARLMARTRTRSGLSLPDRLADLVDGSSPCSLSLVRTLASFYEQLCVNMQGGAPKPFSEKAESSLVEKLKRLAEGAKVQRLRVQAAYLLLLMEKLEWVHPSVVMRIDPLQDAYWFQSEVSMLQLLRKCVLAPPLDLQHLVIRKDADITPPPWARPK